MCMYMHIYICMCKYMCICMYTYLYSEVTLRRTTYKLPELAGVTLGQLGVRDRDVVRLRLLTVTEIGAHQTGSYYMAAYRGHFL